MVEASVADVVGTPYGVCDFHDRGRPKPRRQEPPRDPRRAPLAKNAKRSARPNKNEDASTGQGRGGRTRARAGEILPRERVGAPQARESQPRVRPVRVGERAALDVRPLLLPLPLLAGGARRGPRDGRARSFPPGRADRFDRERRGARARTATTTPPQYRACRTTRATRATSTATASTTETAGSRRRGAPRPDAFARAASRPRRAQGGFGSGVFPISLILTVVSTVTVGVKAYHFKPSKFKKMVPK